MVMEGKRLKKCSTSTDVAENKGTKSSRKAERDLETDVCPKKQKIQNKRIDEDDLEPKSKEKKTSKKKEWKKLRKSFKELTKTMKDLQEFLQEPGLAMKEMLLARGPDLSPKPKAPERTEELVRTYECCFKTEDLDGIYMDTSIVVRGFDASLPREDIKSALTNHFSSCGVTKVFVPIECKTGVSIGYAYINLDDHEKAIRLAWSSYMGKCRLDVRMAKYEKESNSLTNFKGCPKCGLYKTRRTIKRFYKTHGR